MLRGRRPASGRRSVRLEPDRGARTRRSIEITAERFSFTPSEIRVKAGTRLEIRLTSDDTTHGFHILGTDIDIELPKRGRGVASVTFQPTAGRYTFECSRSAARVTRSCAASSSQPSSEAVHVEATRSGSSDRTATSRRRPRRGARGRASPRRYPAIRCRASRRWSSRSSGLGWTTSSKSRPRMKGLARPSTARAAPCATACPRSAAPGTSPKCAPARRGPRGEFVALDPSGESLFHLFSVPSHACQPLIPADATVFARRVPIPLFGAGLVEAIPDETLLALEDPVDRNRDGVSGRAAIVTDVASGERRVGRFGWKAQHATLLAFGADAYRNEMGITNELFPEELAVGVLGRPHARVRSDPGSRGHTRSADRPARHRQLRQLHEVPGAGRSRSDRRGGADGRTGVRRDRLRRLPHARRCRPGRAAIRSSISRRCRSSPICCCMTSAPATASSRVSAAPEEIRTPALWGLRLPPTLPARRLRRHDRGGDRAARATRQSSRGADSSARPKATAPRCSRFSGLYLIGSG